MAGPLSGVRVVEVANWTFVPAAGAVLADLGADVIKVEPIAGDGMRMAATPFFGCQRGKRDLALNIKDPEGLELALALVRGADVVHHNMTKGTAARLGLDYDACRAVNPARCMAGSASGRGVSVSLGCGSWGRWCSHRGCAAGVRLVRCRGRLWRRSCR